MHDIQPHSSSASLPASMGPPSVSPVPLQQPLPQTPPPPPKPPVKPKTHKGLFITLAWLSVVLGGVVILITSFFLAVLIIGDVLVPVDGARYLAIAALLGVAAYVALALALWHSRRHTFVKHALLGVWIGLGLYVFLLGMASAAFVVLRIEEVTMPAAGAETCTSALQQLSDHQDAVIPIETDLGYGTGFSIDDKGTVLTAYHVIEGAADIYVNYSTGRVELQVLRVSPDDDLALLKLAEPTADYFQLADIYGTGEEVLAYGYPGNALSAGPPSVSTGIVSRYLSTDDLRMTDASFPDGFEIIQTDAAINPGNSGGPLIGSCGVIGVINSVSDSSQLSEYFGVVSEQGIGYAVSAKTAAERFQLPLIKDE